MSDKYIPSFGDLHKAVQAYLFANRNGNSFSSVGKVSEYGLWPCSNRHAAASELLEEGAPLTVVQRQLRHRNARTPLQKYGHVVDDAQNVRLTRWQRKSNAT